MNWKERVLFVVLLVVVAMLWGMLQHVHSDHGKIFARLEKLELQRGDR
jgi:hypothetical protein